MHSAPLPHHCPSGKVDILFGRFSTPAADSCLIPGQRWGLASCSHWACLCAALSLFFACFGCERKPPRNGKDFSKTNTVAVLLGEEGKEFGNGLEHAPGTWDGLTLPAVVGDVPCRYLNLEHSGRGYLYFGIDTTFKKGRTMDVKIEIEYFDDGDRTLGLQYDASPSKKALDAAYAKLREPGDPAKFQEALAKVFAKAYINLKETVPLTGSKTWETATFHVRGATFKNCQVGGSDFRFWVSPPELYVRRVTVTRERR